MVRGCPGLAIQEEDSQHSWAWYPRALLRLRCRLGIQQFEENKIWEASLTGTEGGLI